MTANGSDPTPPPPPGVTIAPLAVAMALFAGLVRIPTLLASRALSFDDGVYGASAIAMRHGAVPFRETFSSQGPLFLPLVYVADLVGLRTLNAPRVLAVVSGMVIAGFVTAITAKVCGAATARGVRSAAIVAGGLAAVSGSLWWVTGPLTSDGPTIALGCVALWFALRDRTAPTQWRLALAALFIGAAIAVKLVLALPVLVVVVLVVGHHRLRHWVVAAGALLAIPVVTTLAFGPERVWTQVVRYHLDSDVGTRNPLRNLAKLASTLVDRDLLLVVLFAIAMLTLVISTIRTRSERPPGRLAWLRTGLTPIGAWLLLTIIVLAVQHPLWRNHVAYVIPPMAIIVGSVAVRSGLTALAMLTSALLLAPYQVVQTRSLWDPHGYRGADAAIERTLRALPPGARVLSDDPGLVWQAGRRTPPNFVDASVLRIRSQIPDVALTTAVVQNAANDQDVCAVVVTSPERFGSLPALEHWLTWSGYELRTDFGQGRGVWVKPDCRPDAPTRR